MSDCAVGDVIRRDIRNYNFVLHISENVLLKCGNQTFKSIVEKVDGTLGYFKIVEEIKQ